MSTYSSKRNGSSQRKEIDLMTLRDIKPFGTPEEDDERPMRLTINKSPIKIEEPVSMTRKNKNLDQKEVDNPSMKLTTATMITEQVFIGDEETAYDLTFMKQNCISHILILKEKEIGQVFNVTKHREPLVAAKLKLFPNILKKPIQNVVNYMTTDIHEY